jgi:hypothetical protein
MRLFGGARRAQGRILTSPAKSALTEIFCGEGGGKVPDLIFAAAIPER